MQKQDEHDHPAEGDELELVKVEIEDVSYPSGKPYWRKPSDFEYGLLESWVESLREDILVEARERDKEEI